VHIFPTLCHSAPPLPIFPLEFHGEVKRQESTLCLKKGTPTLSILTLTRQLTYRKEDCAMRPIYGYPEKS